MDPRSCKDRLQLQIWDIKKKEANRQDLTSYACPCKKCMGAKVISIMEFKSMHGANPWSIKYMLWLKKNVYQDEHVLQGNIAKFINSCIRRKETANVMWNYMSLPTQWDLKT